MTCRIVRLDEAPDHLLLSYYTALCVTTDLFSSDGQTVLTSCLRVRELILFGDELLMVGLRG